MVSQSVGFCGSRHLPLSFSPLVAAVVGAVQSDGLHVAVGCARGADSFVRHAAPGARVFRASAFGSGRGAFAARSAALVRAVAGSGGALTGFVLTPCPAGVVPARSWRSGSHPSGSWSALALAVGLGLSVFVFWCRQGLAVLPGWGGSWVAVASGPFAGAFQFVPAQLALF